MAGAKPASPDRWLVPVVFLVNFLVFYVGANPLMDDSDVPWHLATGRLLLSTHHLPRTDPWSFASNGAPWYILSWAWDVILGAVEQCIGIFGVFLFTVGVCAGLMAFLTKRLLALDIALPAVFLVLLAASLSLLDFITARPHLAGYVLVMAFHSILHDSRKSKDYGSLKFLPPLMLLWVNAHGSFIAGFIILGAFVAEAFLTKKRQWLNRLIAISFACFVAALMNPYSLDVATGAMRTLGGAAIKYTVEWLPFTFSFNIGLSAWLVLFLIGSNLRAKTAPMADKILAVAWLIAMLYIVRNGALCILLSAPYLAACFDEQTRGLREERKPSKTLAFMQGQPIQRVWAACILITFFFSMTMTLVPHQNKIMSDNVSVTDAIDFAKEHYPKNHYLTDFNFGGQVIYYTDGKLPFFMDSRAGTAYSEQAMLDYLDFLFQQPDWEKKMAAYGIDAIMVSNTSKFSIGYRGGLQHDRWKLVFAGRNANVYIARP